MDTFKEAVQTHLFGGDGIWDEDHVLRAPEHSPQTICVLRLANNNGHRRVRLCSPYTLSENDAVQQGWIAIEGHVGMSYTHDSWDAVLACLKKAHHHSRM